METEEYEIIGQCDCGCHKNPNMVHFVACCHPVRVKKGDVEGRNKALMDFYEMTFIDLQREVLFYQRFTGGRGAEKLIKKIEDFELKLKEHESSRNSEGIS